MLWELAQYKGFAVRTSSAPQQCHSALLNSGKAAVTIPSPGDPGCVQWDTRAEANDLCQSKAGIRNKQCSYISFHTLSFAQTPLHQLPERHHSGTTNASSPAICSSTRVPALKPSQWQETQSVLSPPHTAVCQPAHVPRASTDCSARQVKTFHLSS